MGKLDRLGGAVKKAGEAAMANADARFDIASVALGGNAAAQAAPVETEPAPETQASVTAKTKPKAGQGRAQAEKQLLADLNRKKLTVMLEESQWKQFRIACVDEGLTGQDILERLVAEYLKKRK